MNPQVQSVNIRGFTCVSKAIEITLALGDPLCDKLYEIDNIVTKVVVPGNIKTGSQSYVNHICI